MSKNYTKTEVIKAINNSRGIINTIAYRLGCDWKTAKRYIDRYELQEELEFETESSIDKAESKLFEKMDGVLVQDKKGKKDNIYVVPPSDTALIFYLKTKGKKRGYIEKQQIDHTSKGQQIAGANFTVNGSQSDLLNLIKEHEEKEKSD